jgi:hypothetical protein
MRVLNKIVLISFALSQIHAYAQSGNLAIISGVLQTEDGKRVDAVVRATRIPSAPVGRGRQAPTPGLSKHVRVSAQDKSAAFTFNGLEAGMYELCAFVPEGGYVDDCLWEQNGVLVNLPSPQIVKGVTIKLKKASIIRVHVDDPDHLIRNSPQGHLMMGVIGPGNRFLPMIRKNEDGQGKDYILSIPFDRDIKFHARTAGISVVDDANNSIDNGQGMTVRHSSSAAPPQAMNYHVTGKK